MIKEQLEYAVRQSNFDNVYNILSYDSSFINSYEIPLLNWAVSNGDVSMVNLLLLFEADPNGRDPNGITPLMCVEEMIRIQEPDDNSILMSLLDAGAEVNAQDNDGNTAIMNIFANGVTYEILPLVDILLQNGADTRHIENNDEMTARDILRQSDTPSGLKRNLLQRTRNQ